MKTYHKLSLHIDSNVAPRLCTVSSSWLKTLFPILSRSHDVEEDKFHATDPHSSMHRVLPSWKESFHPMSMTFEPTLYFLAQPGVHVQLVADELAVNSGFHQSKTRILVGLSLLPWTCPPVRLQTYAILRKVLLIACLNLWGCDAQCTYESCSLISKSMRFIQWIRALLLNESCFQQRGAWQGVI